MHTWFDARGVYSQITVARGFRQTSEGGLDLWGESECPFYLGITNTLGVAAGIVANLLTGYIVESTVGFCSFISDDKIQHTTPLLPSFHVLSYLISLFVEPSSFAAYRRFLFRVNVLAFAFVRLLVLQLTKLFFFGQNQRRKMKKKEVSASRVGFLSSF